MSPFPLPDELREAMIAHAHAEWPLECCGFIVGPPLRMLPLVNALASAVRFSVAPRELLRAQRQVREQGEEILAIYHSHPSSRAVPSRIDLAEHFWGSDVACVIIGMAVDPVEVAVWRWSETEFTPWPVA